MNFHISTVVDRAAKAADPTTRYTLIESAINQYDAKSVADYLKKANLDNQALQSIYRIIDSYAVRDQLFDAISAKFAFKRKRNDAFVEQKVREVIHNVTELDAHRQLATYLTSGDMVDYFALPESGNIMSYMSNTGINPAALDWILNHQWTGTPNVGRAEFGLALLLDGGAWPVDMAGDLHVHGELVEVKATGKISAFRLAGQRGYGKGNNVGREIAKQISPLVSKFAGTKFSQDMLTVGPSGKFAEVYSSMIAGAKAAGSDPRTIANQVAKIFADAHLQLFTLADPKEMMQIVKGVFKPNGTFDQATFVQNRAMFEYLYYERVEHHESFFALNLSSWNYIKINKGAHPNQVSSTFSANCRTFPPNFKPSATQQDSMCGINVK